MSEEVQEEQRVKSQPVRMDRSFSQCLTIHTPQNTLGVPAGLRSQLYQILDSLRQINSCIGAVQI